MISSRKLGSFVFVAALIGTPAGAQMLTAEQLATPDAATDVAVGSLGIYNELHPPAPNESQFKRSLGPPVRDYFIRLDELKAWDGKDANALLRESGEVIYPIVADGVTKSEITVASKNGKWTLVAFGPDNEAELRTRYFTVLTSLDPDVIKPANIFQVTVPAMNLIFLAAETRDRLVFTPIRSSPVLKLEAGKTEQANSLLIRLQPAARRIDTEGPG
jgi:hypothetical protein